jgi:Cu+-exporting ATPase
MLKAKGIEPYMLSGDRRISAETIAARLGINTVLAEVMPADKAKMVKQLQDSGLVVGMVGDE